MHTPIILREGHYAQKDIDSLKKKQKIWRVIDVYIKQLEELFEIQNPEKKFSAQYKNALESFIAHRVAPSANLMGDWIYFPWSGELTHSLNETDYFSIRTNRNQFLITTQEQKKLFDSCVGFIGLSIGSHFAEGAAYSGIANNMKLAEFDTISTSNLNRLKAKIADISTDKATVTGQHIYEINPYANLKVFDKGLHDENLEYFFSSPKPQIIFEAIDDFKMKIKLRLKAREEKVPVIMLTNLEDTIMVDIERFDKDPNTPLFNGLIGNAPEEILSANIDEEEKIKIVFKIVGKENLTPKIIKTLSQMNKTVVGRPQLYSTVSMAGGLASYLARKLLLEDNLPSGRIKINLNKLFLNQNE